MSRRGFFYGLVAGMVIMGLLAATIGAVIFAFRWSQGGTLPLHGRSFSFGFRGCAPGIGRHGMPFGLGAFLCLHALLFTFGGLFLAAMVCKRVCWQRRDYHHDLWGKHKAGRPDCGDAAHEEGAADEQSSVAD